MDEENKERIYAMKEKSFLHHRRWTSLKKKKKKKKKETQFPTLNPAHAARNNHNNHDWKELSPPKLDFLSRIQSLYRHIHAYGTEKLTGKA